MAYATLYRRVECLQMLLEAALSTSFAPFVADPPKGGLYTNTQTLSQQALSVCSGPMSVQVAPPDNAKGEALCGWERPC